MFALTPQTIDAYLRGRGIDVVRATPLAGGVSAAVFRVETPEGRFVVKQSCPQLRTRDAWFSDVSRIFREVEVLQSLQDVLLKDAAPRVLWVDRDNFAFAMTHAPDGPGTWKERLLAGDVNLDVAEKAGAVLGAMHEFSASHPERFAAFDDGTVFDQLRIDPFYVTVVRRCPDVAGEIGPLIDDLRHRRVALCHGDYTPKNMLVHSTGFMLVDYETATWGEPAFDVGLFVAHLALKALRSPNDRIGRAIAAFRRGYDAELCRLPLEDQLARSLRHLGACLLSRTDGTSPVDYLGAEQKDSARQLARRLLRGGDWDELMAL